MVEKQMPENPYVYPHVEHGNYEQHHSGIGLRDWFAGQALAGIMAAEAPEVIYCPDGAAMRSYAFADALLLARTQSLPNTHGDGGR